MDGIVTDLRLIRPVLNVSSGIVGTFGCWIAGIGLAAAAVAFSVGGGFLTKVLGVTVLLAAGAICGFARTAPARWKLRLTALFISFCLATLLAEIVLRVSTQYPVHATSNKIPHPDLGYVLDPHLSDVDANGFRNAHVLSQADIVAIGDSHTQGFNASSQESWPQLLGQQVSQTVYNMGVGGYGPLQYDLLVTEALKLKPKQIIIGLYLGNDLGDVARGIRQRHSQHEIENEFRHTVICKTATGCALHQIIKRSKFGRSPGFRVMHESNPTFVADDRVRFLSDDMDLTAPKIATAFGKTVSVLSLAQQRCSAAGVQLLVLQIPTRESVYGHSQQVNADTFPNELKQLVQRETDLRNRLQASLQQQGIKAVDLLASLASAMDLGERVYSAHDEGHPLGGGYRVYASVVAAAIHAGHPVTN